MTIRFWDKIANKYSKTPIKNEEAYERKIEQTKALLNSNSKMLEVGCGTGSTAIRLAPFAGEVLATDFSEKMIHIAEQKLKESSVNNLRFQCISIEDIQVPNESLDLVSAQSLLHLVSDRELVIEKLHRTLKPGGYFVSSTACVGDFLGFIKWIAPIGKAFGFLPLLKVFKRKELEQNIVDGGFKIVDIWQPNKSEAVFIVAQKV